MQLNNSTKIKKRLLLLEPLVFYKLDKKLLKENYYVISVDKKSKN